MGGGSDQDGANPDGGREVDGDPVRDEFESIVSLWRAEGRVPQWPAPAIDAADPADTATHPQTVVDPVAPRPVSAEPVTGPIDASAVGDHYVPPEPPPLPRIGPPAIVGGVLLALGLLLVIVPSWLGISDVYGLPLGLIALAAGLGWLVLRLWPDSLSAVDRDDGDDDGAVL